MVEFIKKHAVKIIVGILLTVITCGLYRKFKS